MGYLRKPTDWTNLLLGGGGAIGPVIKPGVTTPYTPPWQAPTGTGTGMSGPPPTPGAPSDMWGYTAADVETVRNILFGIIQPTQDQLLKYDYNSDGQITGYDYTYTQRILHGVAEPSEAYKNWWQNNKPVPVAPYVPPTPMPTPRPTNPRGPIGPVNPTNTNYVTPSWVSAYGTPKSPWRDTPASAMQIPYMQYLTGQKRLAPWSGPNIPMPTANTWNKLGTQEQQTYRGTIEGAGMTWDDWTKRMSELSPQSTSPGRAAYSYR